MDRSPLRGLMRRRSVRIALLTVALAGSVAIATVALAPSGPEFERPELDARDYFSQGHLDRAGEFRSGQLALALSALAVQLGVLLSLALASGRRWRALIGWATERGLAGAGALAVLMSLTVALAVLPLGIWAHERAVDVGLSTQGIWSWLWDRGRSVLIGALLAGLGGAILIAIQRRAPRSWWVLGASLVGLYALVFSFLAPVVISPMFNSYDPLPPGQQRDRLERLIERSGVDVDEIEIVDASRRGTTLNAFIEGIGSTRKVVVYDNLVEGVDADALASVVAHELAHVANDDIPRGILFVVLIAPAGMLLVRELGTALAARRGHLAGEVGALPGFAFAIVAVVTVATMLGNPLSREIERAADRYALELTGDAQGLIDLQRRISIRNLSDPDPPGWVQTILRTHPPAIERIEAAEAFRRGER